MSYLTENQLSNTVDLPIACPSIEVKMGDWVTVSSVKISVPMRLTYRVASLQIFSANVTTSDITSGNKIYGNLGLMYLVLRKNYSSGSPGAAGGLDVLIATDTGVYSRSTSSSVVIVDPGVYSWILVNNMQPSTDTTPVISPSVSIDFKAAVTGSVRLELDNS